MVHLIPMGILTVFGRTIAATAVAGMLVLPVDAAAPVSEIGRFVSSLQARPGGPLRDLRLHQLRSWRAMRELARRLPPERRPRTVLYPASGIHVAPIVLAEVLPPGERFVLDLTEMDPSVSGPIGDLLAEMEAAGTVSDLARDGKRAPGWRFVLAGHPVRVRLLVRKPGPGGTPSLIDGALVRGHEMVVSHDWSGDPVTNLGVILALLDATREAGIDRPPALMMEDLEAHPFPIDLGLFGVLARVGLPYGHRVPEDRLGTGHARIELGRPIFGRAVVLGFGDPWWRGLSHRELTGVLDLLVFAPYGWSRRNVLVPGVPPLAAPEVLDWWTAFGARAVSGEPEPPSEEIARRVVASCRKAAAAMSPGNRERLCRLLRSFRQALRCIAAGKEPPGPAVGEVSGDIMPPAMARRYAEARERAARLRERERAILVRQAREALRVLERPWPERFLDRCGKRSGEGTDKEGVPCREEPADQELDTGPVAR